MSIYHTKAIPHFNRITLNVNDLDKQTSFYMNKIGLSVIEKSDHHVDLGVDNNILVSLIKTEATSFNTGLYHFALLLPKRKDLAQILMHLLKHHVLLQGASDHGISEALYLADIEGNGIEIAVDRDPSLWPYNQGKLDVFANNGPLDMDNLLSLADPNEPFERLPSNTVMGHIHLHVHDIEASRKFYQDILMMNITIALKGSALFLSHAGYHHHLATNMWRHHDLNKQSFDHRGLNTLHYHVPNQETLEGLSLRLKQHGYPFDMTSNLIRLHDPANNIIEISA